MTPGNEWDATEIKSIMFCTNVNLVQNLQGINYVELMMSLDTNTHISGPGYCVPFVGQKSFIGVFNPSLCVGKNSLNNQFWTAPHDQNALSCWVLPQHNVLFQQLMECFFSSRGIRLHMKHPWVCHLFTILGYNTHEVPDKARQSKCGRDMSRSSFKFTLLSMGDGGYWWDWRWRILMGWETLPHSLE